VTKTDDTAPPILGPIELRVPALPAMSRVVRLASSAIAALADLAIEQIEDLRLAVSEMMIALTEHGDGSDVTFTFSVRDHAVHVEARTTAATLDPSHPDLVLCRIVLADTSTNHGIEVHNGEVSIWVAVGSPSGT